MRTMPLLNMLLCGLFLGLAIGIPGGLLIGCGRRTGALVSRPSVGLSAEADARLRARMRVA